MNEQWKRGLLGALVVLATACGDFSGQAPVPLPESPPSEPLAQTGQPLVAAPQQEFLTYVIRVQLYPDNFTQAQPLSDESLATFVDDIKTQMTAHINHIKRASNGLLRPTYDGTVTINRRNLPQSAFQQEGEGRWQFTDETVETLTTEDYGSNVVGFAYLMWDRAGYPTANYTYTDAKLVSMVNLDPTAEAIPTHETMHVLDDQLHDAGEPGMVFADDLQPSAHPEYTGCFTTPETRTSQNPDELYWTGDELIQNILSYNASCRGTSNPKPLLNYCKLYGKFGTFSTNLCSQGVLLNPVVSHSWLRQAYMYSADWLYTEWDPVQDSSQYKLTVTLYRGNTLHAQLVKTEAGASDRGAFRYLYFHHTELCNALRNVGAAAGAYDMVVRIDPTVNAQRGHRMNVSGTVSCAFGVESTTYTWLAKHGGTGGSAVALTCPANAVAVGLVGRAGSYVNAAGLLCSTVNADGTLGTAYAYGTFGGPGGTSFSEQCPSGQVLVGIRGRAHSWNDQLSGHCAPLRTWVSSSAVIGGYLGQYGGTGGTSYADTCPKGSAVTSLAMRAATYLDNIQARCDRIAYQ